MTLPFIKWISRWDWWVFFFFVLLLGEKLVGCEFAVTHTR